MINQQIARIFREIGLILEIKGENIFRVRAYEKAARNIENIEADLQILLEKNELISIPGIGRDLSEKIKEYILTGKVNQHQELKKDIPPGIIEMMSIPGLGPKTIKLLYTGLDIKNLQELENAAREGRLRSLYGVKEKTEKNILRGIELFRESAGKIYFPQAAKIAGDFTKKLGKIKEAGNVVVAGSLRRKKNIVGDIDILTVSGKPAEVMEKFVRLDLVKEVLAQGQTKSSVIAKDHNIQVDLRVVEKGSFGAALLYFTGSKEFNVRMRQIAIKQALKINEYGVFTHSRGREKMVVGTSEKEIFDLFGMAYIVPELRENRGEIEFAFNKSLPKLIELGDIRGDFHVHSCYSDGTACVDEIAVWAERSGYEYISITDHSQSLRIAKGLDEKTIYRKIEEIKSVGKKYKNLQILCGTEVDILSGGQLDYSERLLREFDVVIAAIHSGFKQSGQHLTKRIIRACKNRYVNIIAHPTGRQSGIRDAYEVDFDEIFKACRDYNVALEINSQPKRFDLDEINVLKAKHAGVKLTVDTDSHDLEQLNLMELGVNIARRGWLEKKDVINTLGIGELRKWLKK